MEFLGWNRLVFLVLIEDVDGDEDSRRMGVEVAEEESRLAAQEQSQPHWSKLHF